ncbi:hypothetical protein Phum_PHUM239240 [Pediculus humanus corporis]|uniref:Uncharacterized protein n=1 Tax=Pediculus humanus subsp. corporis TaxID=121224 RepID=E0VJ73_PEDHC|nr:uncharacterized protein Phum_PHUM239240 [Pediculus humanus corporis]EEB13429.1 hypothetical protein Phum_PHUM239240 [Pediculus humanus corporis]
MKAFCSGEKEKRKKKKSTKYMESLRHLTSQSECDSATLTATGCVFWFPLLPSPTTWTCHIITAADPSLKEIACQTSAAYSSTSPRSEAESPSAGAPSPFVPHDINSCGCVEGVPAANSPPTMTMDGLETLPPHRPQSALLLSESAAFNVLSFDTCLYKGTSSGPPGGSPVPAASGESTNSEPAAPEPQHGDLNTPVTTSGDIPTFFGPSTVVEPPPITGETFQTQAIIWKESI